MIGLTIFLAATSSALAGYAGSTDGNHVGGGVGGSGGGGGGGQQDSYGYGYSGSFSGPGGTGSGQSFNGGGGIPPQFTSQFDFFNFLNSYFDSLRKYHQQFNDNAISYSSASSGPGSNAKAKSSLKFQTKSLQNAHQNAAGGYGFPGGFPAFAGAGNGQQGGFGGFNIPAGGEGSSASASIGPGGVHQTAAVYPENPNNPNINTRFGEAPKGDGFYAVQTSSFSGSSNIDGKPTSFQQASTTVNDNGKVTSYTVRKP